MTFVSNVSEDGPAYLAGMRPGEDFASSFELSVSYSLDSPGSAHEKFDV